MWYWSIYVNADAPQNLYRILPSTELFTYGAPFKGSWREAPEGYCAKGDVNAVDRGAAPLNFSLTYSGELLSSGLGELFSSDKVTSKVSSESVFVPFDSSAEAVVPSPFKR